MTVLRRADLPHGPRPTLLYGYGGFDIPVLPAFSALFADLGRGRRGAGGGEPARRRGVRRATGTQAGMLRHKQNVFDDLFACARRADRLRA